MLTKFEVGQLRQILVATGFLSALELAQALAEARASSRQLERVLLAKNLLKAREQTNKTDETHRLYFF